MFYYKEMSLKISIHLCQNELLFEKCIEHQDYIPIILEFCLGSVHSGSHV